MNYGPDSCVDSSCEGRVEWLDGEKLDCGALDCSKVRTMEPGTAVYFSRSTLKIADYSVTDPRAVICETECSGRFNSSLTVLPFSLNKTDLGSCEWNIDEGNLRRTESVKDG